VAAFAAPTSRQAIITILLFYAGSIPYSISTGLTAVFYAYEKHEYPSAVTTFSTLLKVVLQTAALVIGWGIVGLAGASIVVNIATMVVLGFVARHLFAVLRRSGQAGGMRSLNLRAPRERQLRWTMIRASWPLMVNHLLAYLFYKVDIFLMEPILGNEILGLYSIGYKYLDALMVIPSMFTLAIFPVVSRQAQDDREAMRRFYRLGTKLLVLIAVPGALLATLAGREMVLVLGGRDYLPDAATALLLMAWSMPVGWINSITQYVLIALDEQRYLTRAYLVGFAFSLIANAIVMPRFGYQASALLHLASETVLFVPFLIGVRRHLGVQPWRDILIKPLIAAGVAAGVAAVLAPTGRGWALVLAVMVAYPLLVWILGAISPDDRRMLAPLFRRS
jgi:O-antigen/teichoic acid export membrane protein